ncbi:MAG: PLP-dependent transferase, partial [Bacteroidota bacterium]
MPKSLKFETLAIRSTQKPNAETGAVATPINLSTTFERETDGSYKSGFVYSRAENPNRQLLENSLAILEKGAVGLAFSSGMAAITALFNAIKPKRHILLPHDVYYATKVMAEELFGNKGIQVSTAEMSNLKAVKKAIKKNTALVWLETPSNPQLSVSGSAQVATMA